jgi:hypothetical protein
MVILCEAFGDERIARRALTAIGEVSAWDGEMRVVTGAPLHDLRAERVGAFAGAVDPEQPVGTFGNRRRARREGAGGFAGDADAHRIGSFGDVDRDVIDSTEHGVAHRSVTGDLHVARLLAAAGVREDGVQRAIDALHHGGAVVLAAMAEHDEPAARAVLGETGRAPAAGPATTATTTAGRAACSPRTG